MSPEKPKWRESVVLTNDLSSKEAKFLPGDEIFAIYAFLNSDSNFQGRVQMEWRDQAFSEQIRGEGPAPGNGPWNDY